MGKAGGQGRWARPVGKAGGKVEGKIGGQSRVSKIGGKAIGQGRLVIWLLVWPEDNLVNTIFLNFMIKTTH